MSARGFLHGALAATLLAIASLAITSLGPGLAAADDGTSADGDGAVVERSELSVAPSKKPIHAVSIDNPLGDVRIEGHDGTSVAITTIKHAPDAATLSRLRVTLVPDPDGTVRLTAALGDGRERPLAALGTIRIDLVVRVPRDARVEGRVGRGRLEADVRTFGQGASRDDLAVLVVRCPLTAPAGSGASA